ncbi:hypothetical protein PYR66_05625 [Klebsiella aerogenes]|uniref:hypothetical protein n=1 Tax=Klebsiella michiganensis TaxID=1134687 RepID=UPI0023AA229E|nr:hypothetical protein [Klebsiella michiganensis]WEF29203.1 hypothetical protein PYR66_05625 [Klebsiella aerogenes]
MNNTDIVDAVKSGMKKSAGVTYLMNFSSGGQINTEYVATVSIGLALVESECFCYDDDKVIFEYPTGEFISATVPVLKRLEPNNIFSKHIVRENANTTRSGRIDIAILDSRSCFDIPKCAIEVKGDNPAKNLLISDIRRNFEYFKHTGPTGTSTLELALNCSFHSYNASTKKNYCITTQHKEDRIRTLKSKYKKYINALRHEIPSGVSFKIDVFTATSFLLRPDAEQDEYELHMDNLHLTLGVIVIFERNLISN